MPTVFVNGKFTAQTVTGVQRSALCLLRALDSLPQAHADLRWVLLCPEKGRWESFQRIEARRVGPAGCPLQLWEQLVLPWAARHRLLVNLSGSAPWAGRRQACLLHDAAVFDHPEAYSRTFVCWYRQLFAHLARRGHLLMTVSEFSRQRLSVNLNMPAAHIGLVRNGADHLNGVVPAPGLLQSLGLEPGRFLLAVGSANPTKNLAALEQAFSSMHRPVGLRLVIAGGHNTRVFADGAGGVADAAILRIGPVDDTALKALYGAAAALVFPSIYEGFGIPPLEAMACGCAVAASRAASIPEICGDAALYFDPLDTADIGRALQQLLGDAALGEQLQAAGRQRAAAFTWAAGARELHRLVALQAAAR